MCMLQVRALQAVLETSGSAFPEAMMGRRESSERYLPKIIIEKSQKIDSIGNRKNKKHRNGIVFCNTGAIGKIIKFN